MTNSLLLLQCFVLFGAGNGFIKLKNDLALPDFTTYAIQSQLHQLELVKK